MDSPGTPTTQESDPASLEGAVGGLVISDEQHSSETDRSDELLSRVLRDLQPFLGHIGLAPIRIVTYIREDERFRGFPDKERFKNLRKLDEQDDIQLPASCFVDDLLDASAPPGVLSHFMQSLRAANDYEENPNEGAWRVHDVLTLASVYMPVQEALLSFLSVDDQSVDIDRVLSELGNRRLLTPEDLMHVLETLDAEGSAAASVRMLAFLYKEQAKAARENYHSGAEVEIPGTSAEESATRPLWLECLLDLLEANGCQGIGQRIPADLLSSDTWESALDRLAFRQCLRNREEADDTASVAGHTVAGSEATLIEEHEVEGQGQSRGEQGGERDNPGSSLHDSNLIEIRRQRTLEFISRSRHALQQIPYIIDYFQFEYSRRQRRTEEAAASDDSESVGTAADTVSTEDNTRVWDEVEAENTLRYVGMSDSDEKGVPQRFNLRAYQEELIEKARLGKNVIIILPTGTGKTFIVIRYVQEYLSNKSTLGRVVFLAPKVKLAEQQFRRFQHFFPKMTYFRCGRSRSARAPLKELLDKYRVYVMTPMCLVEAVRDGEVQITDFSLMVLDECHHTLGKHPYKDLMDLYMDAKYSADLMPHLPQVIGLTASPRVGPGGTLDSATSLLRELCSNMDVDNVCTVVRNEVELERYVNEPNHQIRTCSKRLKDGFRELVEGLMGDIEDSMIQCARDEFAHDKERRDQLVNMLAVPAHARGAHRYTVWVTNFTTKLVHFGDHQRAHFHLFSCAEMLRIYQRALILNEDCESRYALDYLEEQARLKEAPGDLTQIDTHMLQAFRSMKPALQRACNDPEDYNPKLAMLEGVLQDIIAKHQDEASCMVFVRTLELTRAIQQWMKDHPELKELEPGRITGSRKAVFYGGMTKAESEDVMKGFNEGKHKVVVCTSAAEEGLDFQACNIVVRYDYVTSMVAMIQTRGRARRMDSQYVVLGDQAQGNVDKEKENLASERLMRQAVERIQKLLDENPNAFRNEMDKRQRNEWTARRKEEEEKRRRKRLLGVPQELGRYDLLCRKCQQKACNSADIRLYAQSNRIVLSEDFREKWKRVERAYDDEVFQSLEKVAKVHCKQQAANGGECSYDWGCLVEYIPSGRQYPVLKLESFVLLDTLTGQKLAGKLKWGKCPFVVKPLTDEEEANL